MFFVQVLPHPAAAILCLLPGGDEFPHQVLRLLPQFRVVEVNVQVEETVQGAEHGRHAVAFERLPHAARAL